MEIFAKIVNGLELLPRFAKSSISDLWQISEYAAGAAFQHSRNKVLDINNDNIFTKLWPF